ncbi:MAG: hypothetical protein ACOZF0_03535 [Thermodesulfobacteriota bacterium]
MMAYYIAMIHVNIAKFKDNISQMLLLVEKGQEIAICKRNVPIANLVPIERKNISNRTQLGCGKKSVKIKADPTLPMIPEDHWDMLTE